MDVWFVTPAYQRYELSAICFEQRVWAIEQLAKHGISAQCVVVADDDNLRLASDLGFATVNRNNDWLGKKFNDGYEYAARNGAKWVFPVGSDSWVDPQWIVDNLHEDAITASRFYSLVRRDGLERAHFFLPIRSGVQYIVPVELFKHRGYRPVRETIARGCDTSFYNTLYPVRVYYHEHHALETLAFQSWPQITDYKRLYARWGTEKTTDPFGDLRLYYPVASVDKIESFYANVDLSAIVEELDLTPRERRRLLAV